MFILAIVGIWFIFFLFWLNKKEKKERIMKQNAFRNDNYYIKFHEAKLKNDKYYDEYIKWCYSKSEIPMSKQKFIKEVENNEDKIKNLFR